MKLMAAGAAAAVARPVEVIAATPPKKKVEAPPAATAPTAPPAVRAEIENQKKQLAETLKVIRSYPLPPGSRPAFEFHPLKRNRRARAR